ncbi:MAG: YceI family protein [Pseudomonadota bacterium]
MKALTLTIASLLGVILIWSASPAQAAPNWQIDPPHCYVGFFIKHILAPVQGVFNSFAGEIVFDPDDPAASRVDVAIEVKSLETRNPQRNAHLMSDEFFDAANYPSMRFVSQDIQALGQGQFVAHGSLTIKDVTKPVDLPFTFLGRVTSPMNPKLEVAGFSARLDLDRLAYGVGNGKYYRMGATGKDVEVVINLELTRTK